MPLARLNAPFDHPDWIFEPKLDGFRAVAYVEGGTCRLVSRKRNAFKTFEPLAQAIGQELSGLSARLGAARISGCCLGHERLVKYPRYKIR
jgi:ATP-dependent DNA ligase